MPADASTIAARETGEQASDALVRETRAAGPFRGLYEFLQQRDSTVFCKYLRRAQVEDVLASLPSLTIIAPNDLAFAALPPSVIKMLETDSRFLRKFVLHHIVGDSVPSRSLRGDLEITTAGGDNILVKVYDNGRTISIGGANILVGDASYENVIVHIVDRVLYPIAESMLAQTIQAKFGYFYRLLQNSGLTSVLNSDLYTVFIPTQDAINNLPAETSQKILSNNELLKRVVSHHIVPGLQFSAVLKTGATLTPLDGEVLRVTTQAGQLFIDGVPFVSKDDGATNGVIHIVNRLLVPQSVIEDCGCIASHGGGDAFLTGGKIGFQGPTIVGQQLPGLVQHVVVPGTVTQTTHIVSPPKTVVLGQQKLGVLVRPVAPSVLSPKVPPFASARIPGALVLSEQGVGQPTKPGAEKLPSAPQFSSRFAPPAQTLSPVFSPAVPSLSFSVGTVQTGKPGPLLPTSGTVKLPTPSAVSKLSLSPPRADRIGANVPKVVPDIANTQPSKSRSSNDAAAPSFTYQPAKKVLHSESTGKPLLHQTTLSFAVPPLGVIHRVPPTLHVLNLPSLKPAPPMLPKEGTALFPTSFQRVKPLRHQTSQNKDQMSGLVQKSPAGVSGTTKFPEHLLKLKTPLQDPREAPPLSPIFKTFPPCDDNSFYDLIRQALPPTHPLRKEDVP
ncbi:hypothetical protein HPB49_007566 [Dermacentor silvarum]|uniref:Uncharacterized protein n=1 Tax=Dermacentor silvarum TaxID=543639 RepID=A0ACB8C830_DERSI|nr:hypothetical protein HPB49_007566 [Dermacentor silvarum]